MRENAGGGRRLEERGGWRRGEGGACLHTEEERHMGRGRWSSKVLCSLAPAREPGKSLWVLARETGKSLWVLAREPDKSLGREPGKSI